MILQDVSKIDNGNWGILSVYGEDDIFQIIMEISVCYVILEKKWSSFEVKDFLKKILI